MNLEHSVSWAGAEYHPDHTRCKYALPTIDLRCDQALLTTQFRPKQTHSRLIYVEPPLSPTHIRPDSDCSPSSNGNVPVRLPLKVHPSKASLGLCRSDDPSILEGRRLRNLVHPSIHPFPLSVIYSAEDAPNCSANNAIFLSVLLMICSICFADSANNSANDAPPSE